ncbi:hypothetical protein LPJ53_001423 [Coemansia erecta]|uniref:Lysosomal dipeptide transporter MFSD1 n=1 Tax=Coemansia erecta TaxID=147472 RepID=A0A9W8CU31_9FUNG|nr:hypothetical protein LPJ53_001423 [Coemansia erecta]
MGSSLLSPLKSTLKQELEINNTQWASVISMVWVIGTVSPFVAGLLIDTMGEPLAGALAISLILVGNGVCALAVGAKRLSIFLVGRAIYSTGGGAVLLVGEVIMFKWFKDRQLPIAFGCASTIGGIMSFSGPATVTAILSRHANITIPFWLATGLSAFGLACFGVYALIHYSHYGREIDQANPTKAAFDETKPGCEEDKAADRDLSLPGRETSLADGRLKCNTQSDRPDSKHGSNAASQSLMALSEHQVSTPLTRAWARCRHLFFGLASLPETYWHVLLCISIQGTLFIPLHEVIPEMMETEWGYTRAQSSKMFVYLHIIPIVLHISLGILINRVGHRLNLFLAGSVLVFLAALFITFVRKVPIMVSLVMMNFSGSIVPAAIFSLMNLVIDNGEVAGAALGLIRSAEFASVTLMEMLDGLLQDADHNRYDTVLMSLFAFAVLLLVVAIASLVMDKKMNGGLLNSANPYAKRDVGMLEGTTFNESTDGVAQSANASAKPKMRITLLETTESDSAVNLCEFADTHSQASTDNQPDTKRLSRIPRRRYVYLGIIGVLLGTAWSMFILSLTRI